MAYLRHFTDPDDMLDYQGFTRPCIASYENNSVTIPIYNNITDQSQIGELTRIVKVGDDYSFANDLVVTSNMTVSKRSVFNTITVRNNATLTINAFVLTVNLITVEAGSQIRVSPTSVLVAGDGGIVTADVNGLYIEADSNGNGSVVFNETVSNNHPLATVAVYNYSYRPAGGDKWEQLGSPISILVKTNDGLRRNNPASLNKWDITQGWVVSSTNNEGLYPNKCYNVDINKTAPSLDWEFYGPLRGNDNLTFNFTQSGYQDMSLNYTATVPTNYMLNLLSGITELENTLYVVPRAQNTVLTDFLHITTSNIDLYPDVLMMQGFFVKLPNNGQVTLTVNYNDAVLAYYKQKYNF